MVPAQERLRADHPLVAEIEDRLVVQHQFAVVEGAVELVGEGEAPGRGAGQPRLPGDDPPRPQRLRAL